MPTHGPSLTSRRVRAGVLGLVTALFAVTGGAIQASDTTTLNATYTASNGATSTYHYYPAGQGTGGLLVYLDGDGQWGHDHPTSTYALGGRSGIVAEATGRGLDVMSVRTPARDGTWWRDCSRNATYLEDLLTHVQDQRSYDASELWLTGFSGGAQFTTQCYLPRHADALPTGGIVVFGGGGAPSRSTTFTPATTEKLSLHWVTGARDTAATSRERFDALGYAQAGERFYRDKGFSTSGTWPSGVDHNSISGQFGTYIGERLDDALAERPESPTPTDPEPTGPEPTGPEPTGAPAPSEPVPPTTTGSEPTVDPTIGDWATSVRPSQKYVDITVQIPAGTKGRTTVRVDGPRGSYWFEHFKATGTRTYRLGEAKDPLRRDTNYRYRVINDDETRASGTFSTTR